MKTKPETLNPGDAGYEEAFHEKPHTNKDGSINRLASPLDAQREADEENNRAVAAAAKASAVVTKPVISATEKKVS